MPDQIFRAWCVENADDALALAAASDVFELQQLALNRFVANFSCRTLVCEPDGEPCETTGVRVGFFFDPEHLRKVDPQTLITILQPTNIWHPNGIGPFLCIGAVLPGASLSQILYRTYDVLTFNNYAPNEFDSLNSHACSWARRNQDRFPLESRPLKRRSSAGAAIEMEVQ